MSCIQQQMIIILNSIKTKSTSSPHHNFSTVYLVPGTLPVPQSGVTDFFHIIIMRLCARFVRIMSTRADPSLLQKQHIRKSSPYLTRHLSNNSVASSILDDAVQVANELNKGFHPLTYLILFTYSLIIIVAIIILSCRYRAIGNQSCH